jgi:hypothetical protein
VAKARKFSKAAQESTLGKIVDESLRGSSNDSISDLGYATDFIESPQGLGLKLYPAQRLIAKITFGIPLDYKPQMVPVWDALKENLLYTLTESDFLKYLVDQNRCNVADWRDVPSRGFGTTVIYAGRRGGKSQVVSAIAGTCLRNLLSIRDPQDYYNVVQGSTIDFTMLGTDELSSNRLYKKLQADVNRSPFFAPYIRENGTTEMQFVSEADRNRRDVKPSITVAAFACTTNAVRGPSSYFLALDEFQHFKSGKNTNSDDLYKAATPSTANFPSKEDPEIADSRILVISSPLGRIGKMYELYSRAMAEGISSDIFTIRLSTAEMNPGIPASKLRSDFADNPDTFPAEFGGQFLDGKGSYLPPEKFDICVDKTRLNITRFDMSTVGRKYFWAVDYGTKIDATALAIAHLEMGDRGPVILYDYIDRMMVGEKFTGPGALHGDAVDMLTELDLEETLRWLVHMNQILPCFKGVTDQHGGTTLKQLLQINGITTMDLLHLNDQINSRMYLILKGMVGNNNAIFPNVPKFETEFKQLEAEYKSKYVLKVEAPNEKGAHDDMADAVAMVAYIAQKWLDEEGRLDLDPLGRTLQVDPRILNPTSFLDPNMVSIRDIQIRARMNKLGEGLLLPPGFTQVKNPFHRR